MDKFMEFFVIFLIIGGVIFGFANIIGNLDGLKYEVKGDCVVRTFDDRSLYHADRHIVTKYCEVN